MYAVVCTDQFDLVDGNVIHRPTGAEFTPTSGQPPPDQLKERSGKGPTAKNP